MRGEFMNGKYQICVNCIMDTSDPEIWFDEKGVCSHCHRFNTIAKPVLDKANSGERLKDLEVILSKIKEKGKNKQYDCLIGISGGVDSTYVAYKVKEFGLKPLAVHFDSGWNSELAVNNIENIVKKLNIDLYTHVVDWDEMKDLQLAFFKASVANCDIPTDHAFLAVLHKVAAKYDIKHVISGSNFATESILPKAWGYNAGDLRHLKSIHKRFGSFKLKRYPTLNFFARYFYYPFLKKIRIVELLNYLPYEKKAAKEIISKELEWRDYGGKHYESVFTRFFQAYYLPVKFGFDKRRAHLASLVVSGQMSRDEALAEMTLPADSQERLLSDKEFVAKKLGLNNEQFDNILASPIRTYKDFPCNQWLFSLKNKMQQLIKNI